MDRQEVNRTIKRENTRNPRVLFQHLTLALTDRRISYFDTQTWRWEKRTSRRAAWRHPRRTRHQVGAEEQTISTLMLEKSEGMQNGHSRVYQTGADLSFAEKRASHYKILAYATNMDWSRCPAYSPHQESLPGIMATGH